jgi:hypothetical protein
VRVLEARFHPATRARPSFVVIGRVVCERNRAAIEPIEVAAGAVSPFDSRRLHEKLAFLVTSVVGDCAQALLALQSGFWSFVEMPIAGAVRGDA